VLLIIGLFFVSINYVFSHTVLIEVTVQDSPNYYTLAEINGTHLAGYPPENAPSNLYQYLPPVNITNGQTLEVSWYANLILGVFIFSEEQFTNFKSVLPNMQSTGNTPNAEEWTRKNGVTYLPMEFGKKGTVSYNVTETGNYVAVITNAMYGAAYASIWEFSETLISYNTQTNYESQNDSLYLYFGVFFMILGIAQLTLTFFRRNWS